MSIYKSNIPIISFAMDWYDWSKCMYQDKILSKLVNIDKFNAIFINDLKTILKILNYLVKDSDKVVTINYKPVKHSNYTTSKSILIFYGKKIVKVIIYAIHYQNDRNYYIYRIMW